MMEKNVGSTLQTKVRRYLEYINEEEKKGFQKVNTLITSLSKPIRDELLLNIYDKPLKQMDCLYSNFSQGFLNSLTIYVKEVSFAPDDIIFDQNYEEKKGIYLISHGKAKIYFKNGVNWSILKQLKVIFFYI